MIFQPIFNDNRDILYFKSPKDTKLAPLSTFGWAKGDTAIHTLCEYNLTNLVWSDDPQQPQRRTAFDLEKVTKGFFSQIAVLFTQLVGGKRKVGSRIRDFGQGSLTFPAPDDTKRKEFAVRLIGRLVFCWFLKKKRSKQDVTLLPEELLSTQALNKNKGYYHNVLEPLFFEVLNTPMDARDERLAQKPWSIIPFLNGGLFTPHEDDFYKLTFNAISEHLNTLVVPDDWLQQLLEVFETYNFTIDENTPVDVELAIEPEMLGRIFENLLAEINPETGETARKATGSYYTPRPIVEYMVDESLKQYLITKTGLPEEKIAPLLSYGDDSIDLTEPQKDSVIDALDAIKIIDPACGSGAFPMGILQKILLMLRKVDPDSKKWLARILSRIDDATFKKNLERKLKRESLEYVHKLGIIRDAIYGVDIQPIAVEIAKLRCFLSLIVDETIDDTQPNRGVEPLPNLEFKFVCANTLIGLGGDMLPTNEALKKIDELKQVRDEYLNSYGKEKKDLENKFLTIRSELSRLALNWQQGSEKALKLADWNPFSDDPCSWFDPDWMFGVKGGFDVVIGNPPYVSARNDSKNNKELRNVYREKYPMLRGAFDIYAVFLLRGIQILGKHGYYAWIIPNKFMVAEYSKAAADFLKDKGLYSLVNVSLLGVFENSGVYPIMIFGGWRGRDFREYEVESIDDLATRHLTTRPAVKEYQTFSDFGITVASGATGFQAQLLSKYISEDSASDTMPFVVSGCIDPYRIDFADVRYMNKLYKKAHIRKGPEIADTKWAFWRNEKIVIAGMTKTIEAVYCTEPLALGVGVYAIPSYGCAMFHPKVLVALLNSKYLSYYLSTKFKHKHLAGGYLAINKSTIEQLPLMAIDTLLQKVIIALVDRISAILNRLGYRTNESNQAEVKELEKQIDQMVYALYGLTADEIAIVEGPVLSAVERHSKVD